MSGGTATYHMYGLSGGKAPARSEVEATSLEEAVAEAFGADTRIVLFTVVLDTADGETVVQVQRRAPPGVG